MSIRPEFYCPECGYLWNLELCGNCGYEELETTEVKKFNKVADKEEHLRKEEEDGRLQ